MIIKKCLEPPTIRHFFQLVDGRDTAGMHLGFWVALWHVDLDMPVSCDNRRRDFLGESRRWCRMSCTVSSDIRGCVLPCTISNVPVVSSLCTKWCTPQPCFVFSMKLVMCVINFMLLNVLVEKLYRHFWVRKLVRHPVVSFIQEEITMTGLNFSSQFYI
jgi:hypothetical protein